MKEVTRSSPHSREGGYVRAWIPGKGEHRGPFLKSAYYILKTVPSPLSAWPTYRNTQASSTPTNAGIELPPLYTCHWAPWLSLDRASHWVTSPTAVPLKECTTNSPSDPLMLPLLGLRDISSNLFFPYEEDGWELMKSNSALPGKSADKTFPPWCLFYLSFYFPK